MPSRTETLCERLKQARRLAGYESAKAAAEAEGFPIPKDTLIGWESRGNEPGVHRLAQVCEFYRVSLAWVVGDSDHPSGLPVKEAIVDMAVVERVAAAESYEEIEDLAKPCRFCSLPRLSVAFEFPTAFEIKSPITVAELYERTHRKFDALLDRHRRDKGG